MSMKLAASPVSEALYGVLMPDAALSALLTGGVFDDVPEDPSYPFGWYEISDEDPTVRGFGTGTMSQVDVRVHVFSQFGGKAEAQAAIDRIAVLLADAKLTITGWTHCGQVFWDRNSPVFDAELNGVKVHEQVAFFRLFAEIP